MTSSLRTFLFSNGRLIVLGLAILAAGGYFFFGRSADVGATLTIAPGDFSQQVSVSGTVIAARDVDLGFAANGRISGVYAKVGQRVPAGTVLAETENGDLAAALAQKQAALAEARSDLASLVAGTRPEEIAVASAAVANAEAEVIDAIQSAYTTSDDAVHNTADAFFTNPRTDPKLTFTTSNAALKASVEMGRAAMEPMLASWSLLVAALSHENVAASAEQSQKNIAQVVALLADMNDAANQSTSSQTVTTLAAARIDVNSAATALTADIATLSSAQKNLALKQAGSTPENIASQEASVAAAQADVESARATLAKTRVVSPFPGIVTRMDAKVGEIVSPTASLISLQSDGIFEIETFVPEVTIARVMVGNSATTTLDAYGPAVAFPAVVTAVDPAETMKDGVPTYKTTLAFLSADARIRSGMTANVVIETGVLRNAVVIPAGAVGTKEGVPYVSVLDADGDIVSRTVATGPSPSLGQIEIRSGLSAGDTILLAPAP